MSKFQVPSHEVNNGTRNYSLNPNLKQGFRQARQNGQVRLALEYMDLILDVIDSLLSEAEDVSTGGETKKPAPKKAATKSRAKKSAAKLPAEETDED